MSSVEKYKQNTSIPEYGMIGVGEARERILRDSTRCISLPGRASSLRFAPPLRFVVSQILKQNALDYALFCFLFSFLLSAVRLTSRLTTSKFQIRAKGRAQPWPRKRFSYGPAQPDFFVE